MNNFLNQAILHAEQQEKDWMRCFIIRARQARLAGCLGEAAWELDRASNCLFRALDDLRLLANKHNYD